ncbi:AAA family ATPase [Halofilum ochraceum]|uniref:AAA family ATPase n=1 Tax=Halofilum ochraceum TaxID=1611323 RepID=UPI0008DA8A55|nr:AAA family ATPase [Halofilum ochraceum]
MHYRLNVLVAGSSASDIEQLEQKLRHNDNVAVRRKHIVNGHADPLHDCDELPDALVLSVSGGGHAQLAALTERGAAQRPPLLVVGPPGNVDLIRTSMRAGARDFLEAPVSATDLDRFIDQVVNDRRAERAKRRARLTAVINAKGGAGGSMVAANLARNSAARPHGRTLLMDLDVQFGTLPLYFNLVPRNGLVRALELVESIDAVALEGYVMCHESGLDLIASAPDDLVLPAEIPEERIDQLLDVVGSAYDDIFVDLPRWIAGSTAVVLDRADRILIVLQQSVAHLRDTKRMTRILQHDMGVAASRLALVVNRFDKRNAVTERDIREALPALELFTLPNDYRLVTESINMGSPLRDLSRRAAVTRDLETLTASIGRSEGISPTAHTRRSLFSWLRA